MKKTLALLLALLMLAACLAGCAAKQETPAAAVGFQRSLRVIVFFLQRFGKRLAHGIVVQKHADGVRNSRSIHRDDQRVLPTHELVTHTTHICHHHGAVQNLCLRDRGRIRLVIRALLYHHLKGSGRCLLISYSFLHNR